jgi:hypothetical protein
MEPENTGQKILDPIERAKLGLKVLNMSAEEADETIDAYISQGNYDQNSVDYFKGQIAIQNRIKEKGAELLVSGAQILRLVAMAVARNLSKTPLPPVMERPVSEKPAPQVPAARISEPETSAPEE